MKIKIRKAKPTDWKTIQKLNNEVFQNDEDNDPDLELNWPYSDKGIKYYKSLSDSTYGNCLIAEVDGDPAGYVALAIKDFGYRKSKYVEIENIGVTPKYRSQGIGKILMDAAEKWTKEQKSHKLYVSAYWGNSKAIKYYKNNGFTEIGIELEKLI